MLVLNRRRNEAIRIGDDITVIVGRISGRRVALGIDAPEHVSVFRGEQKQDRQAESVSSPARREELLPDET
jgi:carbon storage regulator